MPHFALLSTDFQGSLHSQSWTSPKPRRRPTRNGRSFGDYNWFCWFHWHFQWYEKGFILYQSCCELSSTWKYCFISDFHKIGGFVILQPCLNSPHQGIRWRCAQLIACITQNNPYCQSHAVKEEGLLPILLKMLENDSCPEARIKALYAVSCNLSDSIPFL